MAEELVRFIEARLDEEADLARRCDGDGCGEWGLSTDTRSTSVRSTSPVSTVAVPIFVWEHETDSRRWVAGDLRDGGRPG